MTASDRHEYNDGQTDKQTCLSVEMQFANVIGIYLSWLCSHWLYWWSFCKACFSRRLDPDYRVVELNMNYVPSTGVNRDRGGESAESRQRHRDKMSLPARPLRPDSPPVSQSTPVAGILLWITVIRGELGQTGWIGTGRGNGDNPKDKQNTSLDIWKKGCPDSPNLAQFTPAVPIHPHGQYIQSRKTYNNIIRN